MHEKLGQFASETALLRKDLGAGFADLRGELAGVLGLLAAVVARL